MTHGSATIDFDDLEGLSQINNSGSFGVLSKADYLGTEVAVKEFLDLSKQDSSFNVHKYIEREVASLKEARHPNVVQFMGCSIIGSKVLLVTEFVPGGTVKDWISDYSRDLSQRTKISIATDVARAMAFLHAHDIIHRDLKSDNLLVTENRRIKVCDFGFSRPTPKNADEERRLSFCGTDSHMAPEIILGITFDKSVDIFSFGVVLVELAARACVDDSRGIFKRVIPGFGLNADELWSRAVLAVRADDDGPTIQQQLDELVGSPLPVLDASELVTFRSKMPWLVMAEKCVDTEPAQRPTWKEILLVLKENEATLLSLEPNTSTNHAGAYLRSKQSLAQSTSLASVGSLVSSTSDDTGSHSTITQYSSQVNSLAGSIRAINLSSPTRASVQSTPSSPTAYAPSEYSATMSANSQPPTLDYAVLQSSTDPALPESPSTLANPQISTQPNNHISDAPTSTLPIAFTDAAALPVVSPIAMAVAASGRAVRLGHAIPHRFSLVRSASIAKCERCSRRVVGMAHRHLECDDCGAVYHKRCGTYAPNSCGIPKELRESLFPPNKGAIDAPYHHRRQHRGADGEERRGGGSASTLLMSSMMSGDSSGGLHHLERNLLLQVDSSADTSRQQQQQQQQQQQEEGPSVLQLLQSRHHRNHLANLQHSTQTPDDRENKEKEEEPLTHSSNQETTPTSQTPSSVVPPSNGGKGLSSFLSHVPPPPNKPPPASLLQAAKVSKIDDTTKTSAKGSDVLGSTETVVGLE